MTDFNLRPAQTTDAAAISALIHSVSHYFTLRADGVGAEPFFASITPDAILGYLQSTQFNYWVMCDQNARVIATIALRDNAHLYHFFVQTEAHGKGHGKRLWQHAREYGLANGNPGRFTVNASLFARDLYTRFGFVACDEIQETHGLRFLPMCLDLNESES